MSHLCAFKIGSQMIRVAVLITGASASTTQKLDHVAISEFMMTEDKLRKNIGGSVVTHRLF